MSFQVDTAFVKQFNTTVNMLLQQKGSKLRSAVTEETMNGEEQFFEQVGPVAAQEVTTRHGDSPLISTPHDRRRITLRFYDWGDLIDNFDKVRMLIDPTSPYTQNAVNALGRAIDDVIMGAGTSGESSITYPTWAAATDPGVMFGKAFTGKAAATTVTFPSGQQIAVNFGGTNVGITVPKLIESRRKFAAANVDLDAESLYAAISSRGLADLLNTTQVTSADFSSVQALVGGNVNALLGYTIIRTERLPQDGTSWMYPVWAKSGVKLGVAKEIQTEVARRADKRFSWYVYACMGLGGVRMEEGKVVQIAGLI
jgi:hypothetical protein